MHTPLSKPSLLWELSKAEQDRCNLQGFIDHVGKSHETVNDFDSLYRWSIESSEEFWPVLWEYCGVISSRPWDRVVTDGNAMPGAKWFEGAELNFAENLLRYRDDRTAIIAVSEGRDCRTLTYRELYLEVAKCADRLKSLGVEKGDRVAGYMPNIPETTIAMLAATSLGAIWSSCSPDFGVKGVLERFSQIKPKILFSVDGYRYNGKRIEILDSVKAVVEQIPSIETTILTPFLDRNADMRDIPSAVGWGEFSSDAMEIDFRQLPFDHPLYILYSSGTTGKPKCIVHGAGGTLLKHLSEQQLHCDLRREDTLFFFTTCGWMMWNWLVSGLATGCTLVTYEGSPFSPGPMAMWEMAERLGITLFGTSARYISACIKAGIRPGELASLDKVRVILSTGSPLAAEGFDYIYDAVKPDVMLSSISGGTDIIGCFVLGNPLRPVYRGEIQCRALGMAVEVYDDGRPVRGQRGELVCTRPFPSMPLGFWNEPDNERYHEAYFSRFEHVWTQGDYAEITEHDGMIIHGRSDAVLNPGGVRIGTAEIYRQVEKVDEVLESLCIAQRWENDVRIVLFVMLREHVQLDNALKSRICSTIRENATPRHVPAKVVAVADIPRTLSGKIVELAVRNVVHGEEVKNIEALANPEALDCFRDLEELRED